MTSYLCILQGTVTFNQDLKQRARYLANKFDFDVNEAKKIWCFGPHTRGANMLVDCTRAVQGLGDIRDGVSAGFQWASEEVRSRRYPGEV